MAIEQATFAGGCFWCTEALFKRLKGVDAVVPGYTGGHTKNPTYDDVCSGSTGHAEAINITFDNAQIPYEKLVEIFMRTHNPTTPNQQGNDVGTQYRSAIFYHDEQQRDRAKRVLEELSASGAYDTPIVTELTAFDTFYEAESYHRNYYDNNSDAPYCNIIISPKIHKLLKLYKKDVRDEYQEEN